MVVVGWCGPPTELQTITVPTSSKPSMMYVRRTHCTITYGTTDDYGPHIQQAINDVCQTYSLYHHLRNYRRLRSPHPASHQWCMSDVLIVPSPTELQTITVPTSSKPSMMYVRRTHCTITYGTTDDYGTHIQQAINVVATPAITVSLGWLGNSISSAVGEIKIGTNSQHLCWANLDLTDHQFDRAPNATIGFIDGEVEKEQDPWMDWQQKQQWTR